MKFLTRIFLIMVALFATVSIYSCSSQEDVPKQSVSSESHYCKVNFNVIRTGFDDEVTTRSATQWENGDTIYLLFTAGDKLVYGDAVYEEGEWYVNYNGDLIRDTATKVKAYYFENKVSEKNATISLNENTAIYEDNNGSYTIIDGSLSITAALKPKTGRIRFKGENQDEIKIYGITRNTTFNRYTGEYSTSKGMITTKGSKDEYTPYFYGEFTDSVEPRLNIWKASEGFTRIFSDTIYKTGESGYVTIPTSAAHNGWQNNVTFKVNNVEFTMIPVEYSDGNFLMAQTETTEALYEAVINDGKVSQLPKNGLSYSEWESFISSLNNQMEVTFKIPSLGEWQYAAKGGSKSQYFTYSGSNNIDDVAWYKGNSNSTPHEVAIKQPNELGFYDMSGNVAEYTSTRGYYGYNYCGGTYSSAANDCRIQSFDSSSSSKAGLRIAMSNN